MKTFGALDWLVVITYMVVVLAVGLWFSRGQKGKRDYFLGGRALPWWVVGFSIVATETSALTFIGVPSMAIGGVIASTDGTFSFTGGSMTFMMVTTGYVIGRVIIAIWVLPYYFNGDVYTPNQLLNRAFGPPARVGAALLAMVDLALGQGVRVLVPSIAITLIMQTSYPDWQLWMSIAAALLVALAYTAIGGIKAVVWTDMLQYFIFVGGGLFALLYIPSLLVTEPGESAWGAMTRLAGNTMTWWNSGLVGTEQVARQLGVDAAQVSVGALVVANIRNILGGPLNLIMGLIPMSIGIVCSFGFNQLNVQRVLGCRNVNDGRKALIMSAILIVPQFLMFLLVGCALYAWYRQNGFAFDGLKPWDPLTVNKATGLGDPKTDFVFPIFIVEHVPTIMKGVLVAGILSAAMSSLSSALSAMSSIAVMDIHRPLRKRVYTPEQEMALSRWTTVGCGIALGMVAWLSRETKLVIDLAFTVAGLTAGPILGAFVYAIWRRRGRAIEALVGMGTAFVFMTLLIYVVLPAKWFALNWPWYPVTGMTVCLIAARLTAVFTTRVEGDDIMTVEKELG